MLWPVHFQKVPQALEHLWPAKLLTRCDVWCACQSICLFIPTDSDINLCSRLLCMAVCQPGQPILDSTYCRRFIGSMRMMACVICASCWQASHCITCVTASASMVRLEVMTLWALLSVCTVLPPCLTMTPTRPVLCDRAIRVDHNVMSLAVGFHKHLYLCIGFSSWPFKAVHA